MVAPQSAVELNETGPNCRASASLEVVRRLRGPAALGEPDPHRAVRRAPADGGDDLVVARDVDQLVDDLLERRRVGVEELALREVVEEGPGRAVAVRVLRLAAVLEQPGELLPEERDRLRLRGEGALGEPAEEEGRGLETAVCAPLPDDDVVDRLEVVDGARVVAEVDVDDPVVVVLDREVPPLLVHDAREDDVQERGLPERAERGVVVGLEAVRAAPEPQDPHQDVVLVDEPVEELPRGGLAAGPFPAGP